MKKSVISLLIATLISLSAFAQDEIPLPSDVVSKIIEELIIKDGMEFKLSKQDSIIHIYEHRDSLQLAEIGQYKLNAIEYEKIIGAQRQLIIAAEAKNRDLKKEIRRIRFRAWLTAGGIVILVLLL